MAREKMITRTFKVCKVNALCMDIVTCEPFNKIVELPRPIDNPEKLIKAVRNVVEEDTIKVVAVVDTTVTEKLMACSELEFLAIAHEIPARTEVPVEAETEAN